MADHRRLVWLFCMASIAVFGGHRVDAQQVSPRVRPVGTRMASLLTRARLASPTLAGLVDALERSDVIVHIEERWWWRDRRTIGQTQLVAYAGEQRYLRISIAAQLRDEPAMALIGHELHHAWEIARAAWVVDQDTLARLYQQIGHTTRDGFMVVTVDTREASWTAEEVRRELRAFGARSQSAEIVSGVSMKR